MHIKYFLSENRRLCFQVVEGFTSISVDHYTSNYEILSNLAIENFLTSMLNTVLKDLEYRITPLYKNYNSEKDIYLSIDFRKKVVEYSNTGNIPSIEVVVSKLNKLLKD